MLALGFAAALRRSELVALTVEDIAEVPEGVRLTIRRSRADQAGEGFVIAIPAGVRLRPYAVLREWLKAAGITSGPIFRSINKGGRVSGQGLTGHTVAAQVKHYAAAAGFVTSAASAGATVFKMQAVSRHKSMDVLSGYVCDAEAFKDHAGSTFL